MTSAFLTCVSTVALAQTLPTGGSVAAGSASISSARPGTLSVNQSSSQAIVNWQSFSVGSGGTVNFNQPSASSATLNRVTGSTPSSIAGTINAPGTVVLVNPNGIAITKSGVVNTGSFAASTLDIKNEDFLAGRYKFTGNGSSATVTNAGRINVSDGGFAALLGGRVANDGVITARLGKVGLASGEMITLDMSGDGFVSVAVPTNQLGNLRDGTGKALVSNKGKIRADGGTVFLSAATATTLLRDAVNVPGSIRANSVGTHNGRIVIGGGLGGRVNVTGRLAANGRHNAGRIMVRGAAVNVTGKVTANGKTGGSVSIASTGDLAVSGTIAATGRGGQGGRIDLAGADVTLVGALIDASGATGGGLVRIGGTFQGGHGDPSDPLYQSFIGRFGVLPEIASAQTVSIDSGSTINVSSKAAGDAGTAVVWSDQYTGFAGHIVGSALGGKGAFAEVSSKNMLDFSGTINLVGGADQTGTLLLDPRNVTISTGANVNENNAPTGGAFTPSGTGAILNVTSLTTALASANVIVNTTGSGGDAGTIIVATAIGWTSNSTLTLTATSSIFINAAITAANGGLTLNAGSGSNITTSAAGTISVGTFTLNSGNWTQNGTLPNFAANNFVLTGGTFLRTTGGDGSTGNAYQIQDVYGLQGMTTLAASSFKLTADINAIGTQNWNAGAGFLPIGRATSSALYYTGSFDGQGHTISNLTINRPTTDYVGLFGYITSNSIKNVTLTNANITGKQYTGAIIGDSDANPGVYSGLTASGTVTGSRYVGGIIGDFYNASLTSSSFSGAVTAGDYAGGLVGLPNIGTIQQSSSSATVNGTGDFVGGLAGYINGLTISNSYATGAVTSFGNNVGGLVGGIGVGSGSVQSSYATGNVQGSSSVGGLVGFASDNFNSISRSYATGTVTATNFSLTSAGGLVGSNSGSISQSYATGAVRGRNDAQAGGLVGSEEVGGNIADSYAQGSVSVPTSDSGTGGIGGLVGWLQGGSTSATYIARSYATGAVSGPSSTRIGALIGSNPLNTTTTANQLTFLYYDSQTTGVAAGSGFGSAVGTGRTTAQLQSGLPAGFSGATWGTAPGYYPLLLWQPGFIAGTVYSTYGGTGLAGITVTETLNGSNTLTAVTDSTGSYSFYLGPSGVPANSSILASVSGTYSGVTYIRGASGSAPGLNIYNGFLSQTSSSGSMTAMQAEINAATAGNAALTNQVAALNNYVLTSTASSFVVDRAITPTTLVLSAAGPVTQSVAINATNLALLGTGATYTLTHTSNRVGTIAGNVGTGTITYNNGANDLSIGGVGPNAGITAGTFDINVLGSVSQTQAISAGTLNLYGKNNTVTLTNPNNNVGYIYSPGQVIGGGTFYPGSINFVDKAGVALAVNLIATGNVTLSADTLTIPYNTLTAYNSTLTILPTTTNRLMRLGNTATNALVLTQAMLNVILADTVVFGSTASTGALSSAGTVLLTSAQFFNHLTLASGTSISLGAALTDSRSGSVLTLNSLGNISAASGAITANNLLLLGSSGTQTLTNTGNNIATLAANVGSATLNVVNNKASFTIGSINGTDGVTAASFQLGNTSSTVQTNAITANLSLSSTGGSYNFSSGSNRIGTLAASIGAAGTLVLNNGANDLTVGTVGPTSGFIGAGLTLTTTGTVSQGTLAAQAIGAPSSGSTALSLQGNGGTFNLTNTSNRIGNFSASVGAGTINLYDNAALNIFTVNSLAGVSANTLNLSLASGKGLSQTTGAPDFAINVSNLSISGTGNATYALLNTSNAIGNFAANVSTTGGTISLYDSANLTIGSVNSINGVTAANLYLNFASGIGVSQTQAINVGSLALAGSGAGGFALTNASNNVVTFAANVGSGSISLTDTGGLAVDTVNSVNGVTAASLTLANTGPVTQSTANANRKISVGSLTLLGAGSYTLANVSNSVGTLAANSGAISLFGSSALVVGTLGSTTGITSTGQVSLLAQGSTSDIALNAAVVTPGTFTLSSGRDITAVASVNVGAYFQQAGNWSQIAAVLPSFAASDLRILVGSFLRAQGGTGAAATPYMIADVYGLQGMGTSTTLLSSSFKLANNIDASGTSGWNSGSGFVPVGTAGTTTRYSGIFDGAGHVISGLVINRPGSSFVGLFGDTYNATIANVGLVGGSITGSVSVGSLIGYQNGGSIVRSFSTAAVTGFGDVGGLVGIQGSGSITQSYATGTVIGSSDDIGGLVGSQYGSITQSYATGSVTGASLVGGLVGYNSYATISQSYAVGAVSGTGSVGGLVGSSDDSSYITTSYWNTQTTRQTGSAGGIGRTTTQMQDLSAFATNYSGFDFQNVWAPPSAGYYPQLYAMTAVVWDQAVNKSRTYGDANPTLTASIHGGPGSYIFGPASDALNVSTILSTTAIAASGVNSYAITNGTGATATSAGGVVYRVVSTDGTLSVTQRAITVTADGKTRSYGDANPALTYQVTTGNLVNGDSLAGALGSGAVVTTGVGSYAIGQNTVTSANNPNYAISYVGANLDIGARAITVTADGKTRSYGDANPALTYQVTTGNLVNGDSLAGALGSGAVVTTGVGSYAIGQNTVTSANNPNYAISYVGANLDIGARAITVTADGKTRSYGDANPALTYQVTTGNLVNGDSLAGALGSGAVVTTGVGSYAIGQNTVTSANNPNYAISYVGANLDIGARAITVTADGKTRSYGDANPALTYQVTTGNLVNGDSLAGALGSGAVVTTGVGSYAIGQNTVTSANNPNYAISYVGANLDIGARAITVTADGKTRSYGDANPALTYQVTTGNLVNGDSLAGALGSGAVVTTGVGSYAIGQNTVTSANNPNYAISYVGANLDIGARAITVTADGKTRSYGDANPALTYQVTTGNLVNGDSLAGALGSGAVVTTGVGSYAIGQNTVTSANNPNYAISYVGANLDIGARAITVTADGKTRSYGDANPALTYQVTTGNLVNGDSLAGALGSGAVVTTGVGSYAIGQNTVTSANNPNYAISYVGANLDIGARAITVTADGKTRSYGDANPALTYQVTTGNLVNGDSLAGALGSGAVVTTGVGSYAIGQNTVTSANNPNYAISYVGANLDITQATLLASADAASRVYGDANPALSGKITGFKNNETAASFGGGVWTTPAGLTSDVGSYGINGGLIDAPSNYVVAQSAVNATALTITPRATGVASSQLDAGVASSQVSPPTPPSLPTVALTIPSSPLPGTVTQISTTTTSTSIPTPAPTPSPVRVSNAPSTDVEPAALPQGVDLAVNNGFTYLPISQYDSNQYSDFKTPDYSQQAGEAAVFVMIARGVDKEHAADAFIDGFWNAKTGVWSPPKTMTVDKVTFSDGAGKTLDPTGNTGVPIVKGSTDFSQLLKNSPVMISDGGQPAHWLLATQMAADGKGIVANDPATGKQIVLGYDLATKTLGGVTGVFDSNSKKFVSVGEAGANTPNLTELQSFVASTFLVVNPK